MSFYAGVDSSTQSTKVVLYDQSGLPVGAGSAPHTPTFPPVSEQDPESWWQALIAALGRAAEDAGVDLADVQAISVAAQCHGLVALDARGRVLRAAKLWNDTTSAPQMQRLLDRLGPAEWAQRVGSVPTSAFTVSKLLWLQENDPGSFRSLGSVLLPHDWLTWRMTGQRVTDRSEASGTGYFDASRGTYDLDILSLIDPATDWEPLLPAVLGPTTAAGVITEEAARDLGLRPGTLVGPGAGDQHASALGLGVGTEDVAYSFGTSGVVFSTSANPVRDAAGIIDGVADAAGGYLPLVSTLNAARVGDRFASWLNVNHAELSDLALNASTKNLPVLVAYLDGERKPNLPAATGTLAGLTTSTTREQIARAAIEGVIFGLLRGEHALRNAGVPLAGRTIVTGGASRSFAYPQLLADLAQRPVYVSDAFEPVAAGAAIQAAACFQNKDISEVRDAWAAPAHLAAEPRPDNESEDRFLRYLAASEANRGDG
ncbi:xylulokinase [Arthrobacter ruber]|uniref:xylulokinase n=1 Tax=Arthrobacter ruber TaxID=1258893 RepID=UPI0013000E6F|nr:xylulokinase [Arthrobacter ruber]